MTLFKRIIAVISLLFLLRGIDPLRAFAEIPQSTSPIIEEILSESNPTAFYPNTISPTDYKAYWVGEALTGVKVSLASKSLQWVRVKETLVLPRARLIIDLQDLSAGQLSYANFNQAISIQGNQAHAEISVALISSKHNSVVLRIKRKNRIYSGIIRFEFKPSSPQLKNQNRVYLDPSCSKFKLKAESLGNWTQDWVYLGCRLIRLEGKEYRTSSLELMTFWDNTEDSIEIGGIPTPSRDASLWTLQLSPETSSLILHGNQQSLKIHYQIPEHYHNASIKLGLGPYQFSFRGNGENVQEITNLTTVYGSYFITETARAVVFGAVTTDSHLFSDLGVYIHTEYQKILDKRLNISLLIGGHSVGFFSQGKYYMLVSAPQGFEVTFTDTFLPGYNLTAGAFVYPLISGTSYLNSWVRWGGQVFGEVNYISWQNQTQSLLFNASSVGFTFGFPLANLF